MELLSLSSLTNWIRASNSAQTEERQLHLSFCWAHWKSIFVRATVIGGYLLHRYPMLLSGSSVHLTKSGPADYSVPSPSKFFAQFSWTLVQVGTRIIAKWNSIIFSSCICLYICCGRYQVLLSALFVSVRPDCVPVWSCTLGIFEWICFNLINWCLFLYQFPSTILCRCVHTLMDELSRHIGF